MKKDKWLAQLIVIVSMFGLLIASALFDQWQSALQESFGETFDFKFSNLRLWSIPIATVIIAICGLLLFRFFTKYNHKYTAILFLVIGLGVVFYPTFYMTVSWPSALRVPVNYFADSLFFFTGALLSAIGLLGTITPAKTSTE